jgi:hypothetical protein
MVQRFGDITPEGPIKFLEERGFVLNADYSWRWPHTTLSDDETECLDFLCDEWDF